MILHVAVRPLSRADNVGRDASELCCHNFGAQRLCKRGFALGTAPHDGVVSLDRACHVHCRDTRVLDKMRALLAGTIHDSSKRALDEGRQNLLCHWPNVLVDRVHLEDGQAVLCYEKVESIENCNDPLVPSAQHNANTPVDRGARRCLAIHVTLRGWVLCVGLHPHLLPVTGKDHVLEAAHWSHVDDSLPVGPPLHAEHLRCAARFHRFSVLPHGHGHAHHCIPFL
mmetsp:Transcript_42217/g.62076  ORF Transcript_42217/g.62076 Transcript_42217/m.62076 type:complete len:226 (-) Transcript_42217:269-946(-)